MPRYLHQFNYSTESIQGMVTKPQNRKTAAAKIFKAAGGKLVDMYFCFGDYDGVAISEFPSNADAAAVAMAVGATNAFSRMKTTVLITPEESIEAMRKAGEIGGSYRAPAG